MAKFRVMGIAVASGRIAYVVLEGDRLLDWDVSQAASKSPERASTKAAEWIGLLKPEAVISEAPGSNPRKRGATIALMEAVHKAAQDSDAISITTTKVRHHKDKYREARALAQEYPELLPRLAKKPACWLAEPRRMILFEALALALRLRETQ